jgi:TatD DNase family protein
LGTLPHSEIMAIFYDTHAHLDFPDFDSDLAAVVERAHSEGIQKIVAIGTDEISSRKVIRIAEQFPSVFAVVGWHPSEASQAPDNIGALLRELATHSKVVGLGETGLDYHRLPGVAAEAAYKRRQADLFRQHLEVAAELGLNCVIHQRDALEDLLAQFEPYSSRVRGVFHCFSNDASAMRRIVALGSLVSFTGIATFKNGANIRETISATPLDKLMLETDSPYLAPVPYRGKRCEPAYVKQLSETVAQVKGCSLEELSLATCRTAEEFFPKLRQKDE